MVRGSRVEQRSCKGAPCGVSAQLVEDVIAHGSKHDAVSLGGAPVTVYALGLVAVITDVTGRYVLSLVEYSIT